jgi:hypothetical protein
VTVTVLDGRVSIKGRRQTNHGAAWERTLQNDQQLEFGPSGIIQDVHTTSAAKVISWRDGVLALEGEPLGQVLDELARYTDDRIEVADPRIRALSVGGVLNQAAGAWLRYCMGFRPILQWPLYQRQQLSRSRVALSKLAFVEQLAGSDVGRAAAALLWDALLEVRCYEDFSLDPPDDFLDVYGLAEEDLDEDVILSILQRLAQPIPDKHTLATVGPITTPKDFIPWVETRASRQASSDARSSRGG